MTDGYHRYDLYSGPTQPKARSEIPPVNYAEIQGVILCHFYVKYHWKVSKIWVFGGNCHKQIGFPYKLYRPTVVALPFTDKKKDFGGVVKR